LVDPICRLESATKVYESGPGRVSAVKEASISVSPGEAVGVVGPSGSGKTTLLSLIGMLQAPTSGKAYYRGRDVRVLSPGERRKLRRDEIGFVFQQFRLIPTLSVVENIRLPLALAAAPGEEQKRKSKELVELVGLSGKEDRRPGKLSVGEQQRVAVARALANDPALILADEPTSQLDSATGLEIVGLLEGLRERGNAAVVISTHDKRISEGLGRIYNIRDGVLEEG
jgi:putative ABC transport system ATP-binding protein